MARESVESMLKRRVERAADELERAGKRRNVPVSHKTARGKMVRQALAQGERGDVLMLRAPEDGRRARLAQGSRALRGPVMLWYDECPSAMASCDLALHLARHAGSGLLVGFPEGRYASEAELRQQLDRVLGQAPGPVWLRSLPQARADLLIDAARAARVTQLVLAGEGPLASEDSLEQLYALLGAGLILVR